MTLAEATRKKGLAEAEAQRALNDAINVLSDEQTSLKFELALLQALPAVIEKSVEPMKSIDGIEYSMVDGLKSWRRYGVMQTNRVMWGAENTGRTSVVSRALLPHTGTAD